ncbi:MAG: phospho-N-acetylmuramoyl-pentapeptide-transferase [Clostridia bacterium]|nr:phospho-N-acetylmuramoyl-pentapeptide-transferase [Clostridia bacterium]
MIEKVKNIVAGSTVETEALIISFVATIILGMIIVPFLKKRKIDQVIRTDGPKEHLKKNGTPTMGGIIMLIVILIVSVGVSFKYPNVLPVALITLGYGLIGFIDDFIKLILKNPKGLKPSLKMLGLIIVAVAFVIYLVHIDFGTETFIPILKEYVVMPVWLYIPFAVFVILACTNSLNLTDGLDGLAAGVTAIIMLFFVIVSISMENKDMAAFSAIVAGTTIGFLLFNLHPAKVFMGDTGSLALGGAFCSVALMLKMPFVLVIVAGVCVIEAISVILQVVYFKVTDGKRLFKMAPIHHHFELSGVPEVIIVPAFWAVTLLLAIVGVFII